MKNNTTQIEAMVIAIKKKKKNKSYQEKEGFALLDHFKPQHLFSFNFCVKESKTILVHNLGLQVIIMSIHQSFLSAI